MWASTNVVRIETASQAISFFLFSFSFPPVKIDAIVLTMLGIKIPKDGVAFFDIFV